MDRPLDLLERDDEVARLTALVGRVAVGGGAVGVVEGPAGIGKSRLLAEVRGIAAARGLGVLSASGSELERGFGFGVAGQLFEPAVRRDPDRLLAGAAASAGFVLGPDRVPDADARTEDPSFASLHGLYRLTLRLSEGSPLLLTVDDLQWCDTASLHFLAYLRARLADLSVLLLCGLRTSEPLSRMPLLDAVLGDPGTVRLRPRPLSGEATAELVEQHLDAAPAPEFTEACRRATGGNPLLLEQVLSALAAEHVVPDVGHLSALDDLGPASVSQAVLARLGRLGPEATLVAEALSVLGDGAELHTVATIADLDLEQAGAAVAALVRAHVLRPEPPLGFVHPLVATAVYRDLAPGERELRHLRVAELLVKAHAPAEQVATHLMHAPPRGADWVVDHLVGAAAAAAARGAADSAVDYLTRALAEPPPAPRLARLSLLLGRAEAVAHGPSALEHLRAAHAAAGAPEQRAAAADPLARVLLFTGAVGEAVHVLREAADALPAGSEDLRRRLEAVALFARVFGAGDPEALRSLAAYRTVPVPDGVGAKMLAAAAAQAWRHACGPSDAVSELSLAALDGGELMAAESGWAVSLAITNLSYADWTDADRWWHLATEATHRHGSIPDVSALRMWHGSALRLRGELAGAEASLRECLDGLDEWGYDRQSRVHASAHLARVLRDRGELDAAREALSPGPDAGGHDDGSRAWAVSNLELLLAEGRYDEAVAEADDYATRFGDQVRNPVDAPWRSLKARALDRLGRRAEAVELAREELVLARAWGAPRALSRALRAVAVAERDGLDHLEEAVSVVAGSPARLEHARALAALGGELRRTGRSRDARPPLREALQHATACGAEALLVQVRGELRAAGGRARRTDVTGVGSLTASERRVVDLAAAGATNRELGDTLFISPKTVAMHLSNAYRKLGITSRHDLAKVLREP